MHILLGSPHSSRHERTAAEFRLNNIVEIKHIFHFQEWVVLVTYIVHTYYTCENEYEWDFRGPRL